MLGRAGAWLAGCCLVVVGASWTRRHFFADDNSFQMVETKSPRAERLSSAIFDILCFALLAYWLWSVVSGDRLMKIPAIFAWLVAGFLGMHVRIFLHELGHFVATWVVGFQMRRLQVGTGPLLLAWSPTGRFWCEWRLLPRGGFVASTPPGISALRIRYSIIVAAGPLTDAIILWLGYRLIANSYGSVGDSFLQGGGAVAGALFLWTLGSAFTGLLPIRPWVGHRRSYTDGYLLLRLWAARSQRIAEWGSISDWRDALEFLRSTEAKPLEMAKAKESATTDVQDYRSFQEQRSRLSSRPLRPSAQKNSLG
jgi:Zn-dependent protease